MDELCATYYGWENELKETRTSPSLDRRTVPQGSGRLLIWKYKCAKWAADAGGEGQGRRRAGGRRAADHGGGPGGPGQAVGGRAEPRRGHHRGRELAS